MMDIDKMIRSAAVRSGPEEVERKRDVKWGDTETRWEVVNEDAHAVNCMQEAKKEEAPIAVEHALVEKRPIRSTKKRKGLGRSVQIKTRLTETEERAFQQRVEKSGLPQGDFIRKAILEGQIIIEDAGVTNIALLDELAWIRAELGRQGGLLKMVIKPNMGQRELAPEEWDQLIETIQNFEEIKKRLFDMEVRFTYGHHKT